MSHPRVVHCKRTSYDVYIGRPGPWGNPFRIVRHADTGERADRETVLLEYRRWLRRQPELIERARRELAGKVLGCWCAPKLCHGDVLARARSRRGRAVARAAWSLRDRDPHTRRVRSRITRAHVARAAWSLRDRDMECVRTD